ncbi:hypothetical protein B0I37DRAFT_358979 [Chaetomium sp. MPI-CAGE-AT-0009]|nr:hypothetical protein B0I37DRAFT_358979 [Chaetomium sp. MPI-CAGE-AT-0009]
MYPARRPPSHASACQLAAGRAAVPCSSCRCETEEGPEEGRSLGRRGRRGREAVREEEQSYHRLFAPGKEAVPEEEQSHPRVCWKEPGEAQAGERSHRQPGASRALDPVEDPGEQRSRLLVSGLEAGPAAERSHHPPSSPEVAGMEGARQEEHSRDSAPAETGVAVAEGTGEADSPSSARHAVAGSGQVGVPRPRRRHSCYRNTWLALIMWRCVLEMGITVGKETQFPPRNM